MEASGGTNASIDFKGTLYVCLQNNPSALTAQVKNVLCVKLNSYDGFPLTPFANSGSQQAIHITRDKIY